MPLAYLFKGFQCPFKVCLCVGCGDLDADARLSLGDYGEEKARHIYALCEEVVGELIGETTVIEHNRRDRMAAGLDIQTE